MSVDQQFVQDWVMADDESVQADLDESLAVVIVSRSQVVDLLSIQNASRPLFFVYNFIFMLSLMLYGNPSAGDKNAS